MSDNTDKEKQGRVAGNVTGPTDNLNESPNEVLNGGGGQSSLGPSTSGPSAPGATTTTAAVAAAPTVRGLCVDILINRKGGAIEGKEKLGTLNFRFYENMPEMVGHFKKICPMSVRFHEIEPHYLKFDYMDFSFPYARVQQAVAAPKADGAIVADPSADGKAGGAVDGPNHTIPQGTIAVLGYSWLYAVETIVLKRPWRPIASILADDKTDDLLKLIQKQKKAIKAFSLAFSLLSE